MKSRSRTALSNLVATLTLLEKEDQSAVRKCEIISPENVSRSKVFIPIPTHLQFTFKKKRAIPPLFRSRLNEKSSKGVGVRLGGWNKNKYQKHLSPSGGLGIEGSNE